LLANHFVQRGQRQFLPFENGRGDAILVIMASEDVEKFLAILLGVVQVLGRDFFQSECLAVIGRLVKVAFIASKSMIPRNGVSYLWPNRCRHGLVKDGTWSAPISRIAWPRFAERRTLADPSPSHGNGRPKIAPRRFEGSLTCWR